MRYTEFQAAIQQELMRHPEGRTWAQLRDHLALPYDRPCPTWTAGLEREIGLVRIKGAGRALVWKLGRPSFTPVLRSGRATNFHRPCRGG